MDYITSCIFLHSCMSYTKSNEIKKHQNHEDFSVFTITYYALTAVKDFEIIFARSTTRAE